MESKGLNINSFHKNQQLLDAINLLLISYKLSAKGIQAKENGQKLTAAKGTLLRFLIELEKLINTVERKEDEPLVGVDAKFRNFAKSFVEAKGRITKFKSPLFKSDFKSIKAILQNESNENISETIDSLSELRILLEEQITLDSKSIINDI